MESLVFGIIGLVLLFGCVFGVFVAHGGDLAPIIHAAPAELATIGGAAIAAMLIGNDLDTIKGVAGGFGKIFGGPKWKKQDFLDVIFLVSRLMKILRVDGPVALEAHVESPDSSAIFGEYPRIMADHHLLHLITDNIRLMVISSGNLNAYAVEEVMDASIKEHSHHAQHPAHALASMAGDCFQLQRSHFGNPCSQNNRDDLPLKILLCRERDLDRRQFLKLILRPPVQPRSDFIKTPNR